MRRGPEYVPDKSLEWKSAADVPDPETRVERRVFDHLPCPQCGCPTPRLRTVSRPLHDLGNVSSGKPCDVHFEYSQHRCKPCNHYFHAEFPEWVPEKLHYTRPVVDTAVRLVVEDGIPYESACWHMWRDHRVFVPAGTIQNWVEASGKKSRDPHNVRVSRQCFEQLLRLRRRRRTV